MSPVLVVGAYRTCPHCQAPWISPMPDDWTLQLRRTTQGRLVLTPHRDSCTKQTAGVVWGPSLAEEPVTVVATDRI